MNANEIKTRTITLSGRPPVKIREDRWPLIAHGRQAHWDGELEIQANRKTELYIRVRQHEDGRAIIYGVYEYTTRWSGERGVTHRVGYVVEAGADLIEEIKRVGNDLVNREVDATLVRDSVNDCISNMPAQEM